MESLLNALSQRLSALGWAALLPVVMLMCTVYWGVRPWTLNVLFVAGAITLLVPSVAADLLALALIGLGANAFALAKRGDPLPQGSGTTANYPLHTLVFGGGGPRTLDVTLGLVMVAFGVWLVPRTIGAHSGLAKRNGELMSRVRRLTATRVDAVDSAAAELRRVERDLHDGAQARLVALGISLRAARLPKRLTAPIGLADMVLANRRPRAVLGRLVACRYPVRPAGLAAGGLVGWRASLVRGQQPPEGPDPRTIG